MLYVLFLWWFSTGAILYLDGLNRRTFRWTVLGATVIMAASVVALIVSRSDTSVSGAYIAFTGALMIWGWNEVLFLTGFVTGPYRQSCPNGARGWKHFRYAAMSIMHHELLIAASALGIAAVTWGGANQVGLMTFGVLWVMRLSTKLNIFLGVPNLSEEFLPEHLTYLASFFRRRPMNLLFPLSVTASTVALVWMLDIAALAETSDFARTSIALSATLLALGILEHWFLVLPLRANAMWSWGLSSHQAEPANVVDIGLCRTGSLDIDSLCAALATGPTNGEAIALVANLDRTAIAGERIPGPGGLGYRFATGGRCFPLRDDPIDVIAVTLALFAPRRLLLATDDSVDHAELTRRLEASILKPRLGTIFTHAAAPVSVAATLQTRPAFRPALPIACDFAAADDPAPPYDAASALAQTAAAP